MRHVVSDGRSPAALGSVEGARALPAPQGDAGAVREGAASLRRAERAARATPSMRGRLAAVLPRVWAGPAASAAVQESAELVRRASAVVDHLAAAASVLERYAAALEHAQVTVRCLQRQWDAEDEQHARSVALVHLRAGAELEGARLLLQLDDEHLAARSALSRRHRVAVDELEAAADRARRALAALDDLCLPRTVATVAGAARLRLVDGLPISAGAAAAQRIRLLAVREADRLRRLAIGDGLGGGELEALVQSLRATAGDPVHAQALLDELGVHAVNRLVLELAEGAASDVDLTRAAVGALGAVLLEATAPTPSNVRDPRTARQVESAAALLRDDLVASLGDVTSSSSGRFSATGYWVVGQLVVAARASGAHRPLPPALVRRLAAGAAAAEIGETRDADAVRVHGTSLPASGEGRFASLFDDADTTGDALHTFLQEAGSDPADVVALLSTPVAGQGAVNSRGGSLVLAEALVRRWVTYEAAETASHAQLHLSTNADLSRLLSAVSARVDAGTAALRARVMSELARTNALAQQEFSTRAIYLHNIAGLESAAAGWVLDMPESIDTVLAQTTATTSDAWTTRAGDHHQPLLRAPELAGLVGALAVRDEVSGQVMSPDLPYALLVDGELERARQAAADGRKIDAVAPRLGFFEQAASAALVAQARRADEGNQSMWRTLAEAKALALAWMQGPRSFGEAAASLATGGSNRTAGDDLAISLLRSNVELDQTIADEGRWAQLTRALDALRQPGACAGPSAAALMRAGSLRGPLLATSEQLRAARRAEQLSALEVAVRDSARDNVAGRLGHLPFEPDPPPTLAVNEPRGLPEPTHGWFSSLSEVDGLARGRGSHTLLVESDAELRRLFQQLIRDAEPLPAGSYPGIGYRRADGVTVRLREISRSGGATIDIALTDGSTGRIHIR